MVFPLSDNEAPMQRVSTTALPASKMSAAGVAESEGAGSENAAALKNDRHCAGWTAD